MQRRFIALQLPGEKLHWGGWTVEVVRTSERSHCQCDLTLSVGECGDGAAFALEYDTTLFDPEAISRLAGHYETVLGEMVRSPVG